MPECYESFAARLDHWRMIEGARAVLMGLSGGADSMALMHFLHRHRQQTDFSLPLYACHLNHQLRGEEADADEAFAVAAARTLGIECMTRRQDVQTLAGRRGNGIEEAARHARYVFYAEAAATVGADRIALGHHADDNMETILFRLRRGTHRRGMAGIPPVRPLGHQSRILVIRPLLDCRAAELRAWLRAAGIAWREDTSNAFSVYARNRIRHELLPALETRHPGFGRRLLDRARTLARERRGLETQADACLAGLANHGWGECLLPLDLLRRPALGDEVLWQALARAGVAMGNVSRRHFAMLHRLVTRPEDTGRCDLPGRVHAERRRGVLALCAEADNPARSFETVTLQAPGDTFVPWLGWRVSVRISRGDRTDARRCWESRTGEEEWLDADKCASPLAVRPWQAGDRFRPLGAPGMRKVQDFLTDLKVPRSARSHVGIVTAAGDPIVVVGCRIDERVKVDATTRRLLHLAWTQVS